MAHAAWKGDNIYLCAIWILRYDVPGRVGFGITWFVLVATTTWTTHLCARSLNSMVLGIHSLVWWNWRL